MHFGNQLLHFSLFSLTSIASVSHFASAVLHEDGRTPTVPEELLNRYIVKFKTETSYDSFVEVSSASIAGRVPQLNVATLRFDSEAEAQLWASLRDDVEYVEKDDLIFAAAPSNQSENTPYGITMVKAEAIPDYVEGSGIKTCILDTGYAVGHEDLPNPNNGDSVTGGSGFCSDTPCSWNVDPNGHGTHVAGTVAATGDNGLGVIGVVKTNKMPLLIGRVLNGKGSGTWQGLANALFYCSDNGANVVNMSLGGSGGTSPPSIIQDAVETILADNDRILFVAAAGNAGNTMYSWPASMPEVISVAAVQSDKSHASYSQVNDQVDIAAPGTYVHSTLPNNQYAYYSGTSMATPHVSGVAAKVWSHKPSMTAQEVRDLLESTAEDLGTGGRDDTYGHGLVNALAAYENIPGAMPSASPTTEQCDDSTATFMWENVKRSCSSIAKKKPALCDEYEIKIMCPGTCQACAYKEHDAIIPFYSTKDGVEWTCKKVHNLDPSKRAKRCGRAKVYKTCRATCSEYL